ncbi:MAG: hypothetical protein RLZZ241_2029 [Bacteroidota bacterium]|jgi:isopentenyldiphosphate isomerase
MDEKIDIWDGFGRPTGKTAMKSEAHLRGWFHPTAHVWFYTRSGCLLLQKRSRSKDTFPSYWDVSVAGHLQTDETPLLGAIREIKEEIGLEIRPTQLQWVGRHKAIHRHETILDCEFHHVYLCELPCALSALIPQETEVDALQLFPIDFLQNEQIGGDENIQLVPHGTDYYRKIQEALALLL